MEYAGQFYDQLDKSEKLTTALKGSEDIEMTNEEMECFDCVNK